MFICIWFCPMFQVKINSMENQLREKSEKNDQENHTAICTWSKVYPINSSFNWTWWFRFFSQAWPSMLDEFVVWKQKKAKGETATEAISWQNSMKPEAEQLYPTLPQLVPAPRFIISSYFLIHSQHLLTRLF